jgi:hypothetical protein
MARGNSRAESEASPQKGRDLPLDEAQGEYGLYGYFLATKKEKALEEAMKKVPTMESRKTSFELGPFSQRQSQGYVEGKHVFKNIRQGEVQKLEMTVRVEWTGPLDRDDPQEIVTNRPVYTVRRIG